MIGSWLCGDLGGTEMCMKSLLVLGVAASALIPSPAAGGPAPGTARPASVHAAVGATALMSAQHASPLVVAGGDLSARVYPAVAPPRPRYVAGYTPHALQNMAERHITKPQVEAVIAGPDPGVCTRTTTTRGSSLTAS